METIEIVKSVLQDNLDIDPATVTEQSSFDTLGVDSLDMVELVCDLEDRCDIEFGEPDGLETVGQLVAYVDSLR
ncbi:MAG: acyl carrier protein [Slackia piriformis]|uniref:Acyl carrier protein n=1 Tax=Slackia piriformis TaxID=626934 RepID=A0A943UX33_9ACTN|nr:acyl carrier protein [Slackia piriformis]